MKNFDLMFKYLIIIEFMYKKFIFTFISKYKRRIYLCGLG